MLKEFLEKEVLQCGVDAWLGNPFYVPAHTYYHVAQFVLQEELSHDAFVLNLIQFFVENIVKIVDLWKLFNFLQTAPIWSVQT